MDSYFCIRVNAYLGSNGVMDCIIWKRLGCLHVSCDLFEPSGYYDDAA